MDETGVPLKITRENEHLVPLYSASELIKRLPLDKDKKTEFYPYLHTPKTLVRCFRLESNARECDWDGLRRFYDAVEEQGGAAEAAVVRAIRVRKEK